MLIMTFMTRYYHSPQFSRRYPSVSHHIFKIFYLTLFALATIIISSCEEGVTEIGSDILPGSDFVSVYSIDTIGVWSYTMYDNSFPTGIKSVGYLGETYDSYFGTTSAEFVTQIRMAEEWDSQWYDEPITIDSMILHLRLLNVSGGSEATHTLKFSEIAEQIYTDSAYYSNTTVLPGGYEVAEIELPALKADTVNFINLDIPVEFGEYLIRDTSKLFHSNTRDDFRSFFRGLYFQITSGTDPMLAYLYLEPPSFGNADHTSAQNYFVLYMKNEAGVRKDFYFIIDAVNRNASFNRFSHDFNTASPEKKIKHINDGFRDTLSYLQILNGVYTRIIFPGFENLKNDPLLENIAVNKARLTVPAYFDGDLYKPSTAPPRLFLRYKDESGNKYVIPDYTIDDNHYFFDGTIDTTTALYTFNLASFVQIYLEDARNIIKPELEIFQGSTGTSNVILKANDNKTPSKFEFTYTKF